MTMLIAVGYNTMAENNQTKVNVYSDITFDWLPDSTKKIISNKKSIIYYYGHYGRNWSIVYEDGDSYSYIIGTTRTNEESPQSDSKKKIIGIDTLKLFESYRDLIAWGMDTFPEITKNLTPKYSAMCISCYNVLEVFNSKSECIYWDNNVGRFEGTNSSIVNEKYSALCYLMLWLSAPMLRELLPGFEEYIK